MDDNDSPTTEAASMLTRRILWLNARIFGLSLGLVTGLGLFAATNWLILKGGEPVGPHLKLLAQYFWGYDVTFAGSLIGFVYGFLGGSAVGVSVGWVYNRMAMLRHPGGIERGRRDRNGRPGSSAPPAAR